MAIGKTYHSSRDARPAADTDAYVARKRQEIALINDCLATPQPLNAMPTVAAAIDRKFQLAAALRAERSLQSWAITETARPEVQRWRSGAWQFSFGYQRADLQVRGPAVYGTPAASNATIRTETLYTGSGMSAIAVVVTALLRSRGDLEVIAPRGFYSETRELLQSLRSHVTIVTPSSRKRPSRSSSGVTRILLIDSCVSAGFDDYRDVSTDGLDAVLFDTTCFWQRSSRIRIVMDWAWQAGLPLVLVRSHAKLDALGIEYGRLGSVVHMWRRDDRAARWMQNLVDATGDSVRLYGVAAIPAHFPPFTGTAAYDGCSASRTAAIIRSTRRIVRGLSARRGHGRTVREFQHGLYLTLAPGKDLPLTDVKRAAAALCAALAQQGLPVKHAGSFGFDFVAVEWFFDAILRRNVIRVAGADLPLSLIDRIVDAIDDWWSQHRMSGAPREIEHPVGERATT